LPAWGENRSNCKFFRVFLIILRIYSFVWNKIIIFAEVSAYCAEVKNVLNTKKTE